MAIPGSVRWGKKEIKEWVEKQTDIESIVDVGCGKGTYRILIGDNYYWTGIEIWEPYIEQWGLNKLYDRIINKDIRSIGNLPKGDLIIFGDVLEHLPKNNAMVVMDKAKRYKHMILSIPLSDKKPYEGEIHYGNPHEEHISYWNFEEVKKLADWDISLETHSIGVFAR